MPLTGPIAVSFSRRLATLMVVAAIAATVTCSTPSIALADEAPARQGSDQQAQQTLLLTLLHTNDPHGRVHLPGEAQGLAKVATLVRQIRQEMPNVLLLDAGDIIHGTPVEKAFRGQAVISAMNAMAYDAAAAGNHEFDMGQRVVRDAFATASFPFLSANVIATDTGKPWDRLNPYIVREIDGVRVGIFGLTTIQTPLIQWPRTIEGIDFTDEVEAARQVVRELREQERADVVIALTHIGVKSDHRLAEEVPGIDVILGGHSHTRLEEQVWRNGTLVMQTGAHAVTLGRADLYIVKPTDAPAQIHINGRDGKWWGHDRASAPFPADDYTFPSAPLLPLTADLPDDPQVVEAYAPFAEKVLPTLKEVLTEALEPLPALDAKRREFALGHLLADAIRAHADSDFALAPPAFSPRGLVPGPVTVADIYELMGAYTRQHIVIVRIAPAHLRDMVEKAFSGSEVPLLISGFTVKGAQILLDGQPLDEQRRYTLAGPAYVIQDYFWGRDGVEVLQDDAEDPHQRDALIAYLRGHAPLRNTIEKRVTR